jgi:hypothetical protein
MITGKPPYGIFAKIFNLVPYGYMGYRVYNKIYEIKNRNKCLKQSIIDGEAYVHYLPCGKNEKWFEYKIKNGEKITLSEIMKKKWMSK